MSERTAKFDIQEIMFIRATFSKLMRIVGALGDATTDDDVYECVQKAWCSLSNLGYSFYKLECAIRDRGDEKMICN